MSKVEKDEAREYRIAMEIVVDAHDAEEQAMGWYYYLDEKLNFPFLTRCIAKRAISPLRVGDEVEVLAMAPEEECEHEMFVMMRWEREGLAVPLSQLEVIHADDQTQEAVEDWHYWVNRGYQF
ncbi:MAG: calcium-binding protein [Candidatus Binatia bacterium]